MNLDQSFAWSHDGLPEWRSEQRTEGLIGLSNLTPAQAVERARAKEQDVDEVLRQTAQALLSRARETGQARMAVYELEQLIPRMGAATPPEALDRPLSGLVDHLDDARLQTGVGMLIDAVRAARGEEVGPRCPRCHRAVPHRGPWTEGRLGPADVPAQSGATCDHCGAELVADRATRSWTVK